MSGFFVSLVCKYGDNILKNFANSFSIILNCIFSTYLFDFKLTNSFIIGTTLVILSIFLYSTDYISYKKKKE